MDSTSVHWLIPGNYKSTEDLYKSNLASIRMRAGLVGKHAHDIQVEFSAGDHINTKADIVVVGKIGGDCQNGRGNLWIKQLSEAKKQSKKIISLKLPIFTTILQIELIKVFISSLEYISPSNIFLT